MEQERKIEKLLRAYAKKRRGQAGESFKLDPAARRMLQNEISRNAPPDEEEDDTLSLWEVLRRNWAFFLGFAVCVFILASLFLPKLSVPKHAVTLGQSASVQNLRDIPGPTLSGTNGQIPTLDSLQIASRAATPSPDQSKDRTFAANTAEQITNMNLAENNVAPTAAAEQNELMPPPALREMEKVTPPALAGGNYSMAQAPPPMLPQASEAKEGQLGTFGPAAAPRPAIQNNFLNTIPTPLPCSPVLRNFQVSQNGNTIRVVDQDGSVYTGTLQSENYGGENATKAENQKMAGTDKFAPAQQTGEGKFQNNAPPAQNYSFRVGGTNRTLNQRVVFTATLLNELALMKNEQVTFGMSANAAVGAAVAQQWVQSKLTNQMAQLPWSSLCISGTAIINHSNQMQINALPVAPPTKSSSMP